MEQIKTQIRAFLAKYFRNREVKDSEDIFASGYVSSMVAMELVLFVEKEFSTKVGNDDLNLDNFRSIDAIASFVQRKLDARGAA